MAEIWQSEKLPPIVIAGYSSQQLGREIADVLGTIYCDVTYKQFADKEIQPKINGNLRGYDVAVIASAAGDPHKQIFETMQLLQYARGSTSGKITLVLPYEWYGTADDTWGQRVPLGLSTMAAAFVPYCNNVIIADPHNAGVTRQAFVSGDHNIQFVYTQFAFPVAMQVKSLVEDGYLSHEKLCPTFTDHGASRRIQYDFKSCMYNLLELKGYNPYQVDWPMGIKDHDKILDDIYYSGLKGDVAGKDVIAPEDLIRTATTLCKFGDLVIKDHGARSCIVFAPNGLFTTDPKKSEDALAAIRRINDSAVDALFVFDTLTHRLTDPAIHDAIEQSPKIHVLKSAPTLALMISAVNTEAFRGMDRDFTSISAINEGRHICQAAPDQIIAQPVPLKPGNRLLALRN